MPWDSPPWPRSTSSHCIPAGGTQALIAAGTGLGMAKLLPDGTGLEVAASEGGHADFAPRNEEEVALWRFLAARHGRVSVERVVSGHGLVNIYAFLRDRGTAEPDWLIARLDAAADPAAVIAQAALSDEAAICVKALDLFLSAYGAVAGNLALTALATGGLYIGGGIAPKLIKAFPQSGFMTAFTDKGRLTGMLRDVPVRVALEPKTALRGAARCALSAQLGSTGAAGQLLQVLGEGLGAESQPFDHGEIREQLVSASTPCAAACRSVKSTMATTDDVPSSITWDLCQV